MTEYRPPWRPQKDGSTYQWNNCNPTSHGMFLHRHRKGVAPATGLATWSAAITKLTLGWASHLPTMASAIRGWLVAHGYGTVGTTITANQKAIQALWGAQAGFGYRYAVPFSSLRNYVVAGRGAVVIVHYAVFHGTPYDASRTFDGNHAIFVNERRYNSALGRYEYLVFDPLADHRYSYIPQGPQWMPESLLAKAARAVFGGNDEIEFGFTADTDG